MRASALPGSVHGCAGRAGWPPCHACCAASRARHHSTSCAHPQSLRQTVARWLAATMRQRRGKCSSIQSKRPAQGADDRRPARLPLRRDNASSPRYHSITPCAAATDRSADASVRGWPHRFGCRCRLPADAAATARPGFRWPSLAAAANTSATYGCRVRRDRADSPPHPP